MSGDGDKLAGSDEEDEKSLKSLMEARKKTHVNGAQMGDAKPVNFKKEEPQCKEEGEEEDEKPLRDRSNGWRVKKEDPLSEDEVEKSALARKKRARVKKEEPVEEESEESEEVMVNRNGRNAGSKKREKEKKNTMRKRKRAEVGKELKDGGDQKKKEKKVYDLPGQKHDPPEERDPLRIFYESLYKQVPGSDLAAVWMMERGLLPREAAQKVYSRKLKKNQQQKVSLSVKSVKSVTSEETLSRGSHSKMVLVRKTVLKSHKKKRKSDDSSEEDEDDFVPQKKSIRKKTSS